MRNSKSDLIDSYLRKYPNLSNRQLAKLIFKENKLLFTTEESVRSSIRYRKGSLGSTNLKKLKNDDFLSCEKLELKYNLPTSSAVEYAPVQISGNKILIFGDVHIPFHSVKNCEVMFDYSLKYDIDTVFINGDFTDCFELSRFLKEPNREKIFEEREKAIQFLTLLRQIYPSANIYYKFGNHEKRFEDYLKRKAPELFGFDEFRWEVLLKLVDNKINYIPHDKYVIINNGLVILHGHEYANSVYSPANPARSLFLRTKQIALTHHNHQTSEHTESRVDGEIITCWSVGCLCDLHPSFLPLNKWNAGFAIYERDDEHFWRLHNKRIIKNKVV